MYEHIVISGGGQSFFQTLGIFNELFKYDLIKKKEIKTIYSTSSGSIISILISINLEWSAITKYFLERPWEKLFNVTLQEVYQVYANKGLYNIEHITKALKPLFDCADIPLDITLSDFYNLTEIEHHFFSFEVNAFEIKDINYKTFPNLQLLEALQMTCAIPIFFSPVIKDNSCFIDGGVTSNYPIKFCLCDVSDHKTILGIRNLYDTKNNEVDIIKTSSTTFDFLLSILLKLLKSMRKPYIKTSVYKEIESHCMPVSMGRLHSCFQEESIRKELYTKGVECVDCFINENHHNVVVKN
tara:strand:+ start:795 stop:1688 length:894 start_codon:yes stop_codon:yes gene_type:complete